MTNEYRICIIDGKPRKVIVEHGNIVNINPSKDDLKDLEEEKYRKKYNDTNTCDICGNKLVPKCALRERNKDGNETSRWLCRNCWNNFDPNSHNSLKKSIANCRTGNQNPNHTNTKGDLFQKLTCRWRSIESIIPVKDLNIDNDSYSRETPIDHSWDSELGIIQTQGRLYSLKYRWWCLSGIEDEWYKEFNNMIFYCASRDGKIIERIYIFPKEELYNKSITIVRNPKYGGWYEKYRIIDEDTLKKVNDIWKEIIGERL